MQNRRQLMGSSFLLAAIMPGVVLAQSDWHGSDQQAMLLPTTLDDLSMSSSWHAQRHDHGDSSCIRIQDRTGSQYLMIGLADGRVTSFAGSDSVSVSTPSSALVIPADAKADLVYADSDVTLILYTAGATSIWSIESTGSVVQ